MNYRERALWTRKADTQEGTEVLNEARRLSREDENQLLTDGELIRLAYWGVSGEPEHG